MIYFTFIASCALNYGICLYVWITALVKDVEFDLILFKDRVDVAPNPVLLNKKLYDIIEFHSTVKRYKSDKLKYQNNIT